MYTHTHIHYDACNFTRVLVLLTVVATVGAANNINAIISITAHKLTLTPRRKNFQSANVWGPGDFGSRFQ